MAQRRRPRKARIELALIMCVALTPITGAAQGEVLGPLHVEPALHNDPHSLAKSIRQHFIYLYDAQDLPIMDDFSVDRTRHRNASVGDPDVTLADTYYHLEVGGVSLPDMEFSLDTTYDFLIDTLTFPDSTVITVTPHAAQLVTVYDLDVVPPTSMVMDGFVPFNQFDTLGGGGITEQLVPDLIQDTLEVYEVQADQRQYIMGTQLVPWVLWQDDDAFVNNTYPVDPPTIGVATLEGLDRTGYPYDFDQPSAYGIADHLTSVPINMAYPNGDSIYLSFFYQPQGLSGDDQIQPQDSLVLEFFSPLDDTWRRRWSAEYTAVQPFQQVMLPIKELDFLQNGFQFRFLNYGSLSGALDHWHIDYVRLGRFRTVTDTLLVDVAYIYPETSLLQTYTSVPYPHFEQAPASYMALSIDLDQKNLDVNDRFVEYGMLAELNDVVVPPTPFINGLNTSNNASSTFISTHPINSAPNNFVYDTALTDSCAFWKIKFFTQTQPDINNYNDTVTFVQELSNYYSYDDGSAEAGYSLNVTGAKLAYRFDMQGGDSLRAIRMYFDPIFEDPSTGSFLLTVWSSLTPEVILHQDFSFSNPQFRRDGLNHFVEYPLDETVWVENSFYIGWTQTSATKLNLGFDKNRNNQDKIFFNTSNFFANSSFPGSLMMRPVFVYPKDPFLGLSEQEMPEFNLLVYPNPSTGSIRFRTDLPVHVPVQLTLSDALGRQVLKINVWPDMPVHLGALTPGMYHARFEVEDMGIVIDRPLMIQR